MNSWSLIKFKRFIYNTKWWLSFTVVLIATPLLMSSANMHHQASLTLHIVWVSNHFLFAYDTHFPLVLMLLLLFFLLTLITLTRVASILSHVTTIVVNSAIRYHNQYALPHNGTDQFH